MQSHFASLKMHCTHAHRKLLPKWVPHAHHNLLPHIAPPQVAAAHRKSCFDSYLYNKSLDYILKLKNNFRRLQSKLPDNGAKHSMNDYNGLVAIKRSLPDQFADHVFDKTQKDWKYWVFTSIMGHFVHSFEQEVSAQTPEDLQNTSLEWITNSMSLQQLRKGLYLKTFS